MRDGCSVARAEVTSRRNEGSRRTQLRKASAGRTSLQTESRDKYRRPSDVFLGSISHSSTKILAVIGPHCLSASWTALVRPVVTTTPRVQKSVYSNCHHLFKCPRSVPLMSSIVLMADALCGHSCRFPASGLGLAALGYCSGWAQIYRATQNNKLEILAMVFSSSGSK